MPGSPSVARVQGEAWLAAGSGAGRGDRYAWGCTPHLRRHTRCHAVTGTFVLVGLLPTSPVLPDEGWGGGGAQVRGGSEVIGSSSGAPVARQRALPGSGQATTVTGSSRGTSCQLKMRAG